MSFLRRTPLPVPGRALAAAGLLLTLLGSRAALAQDGPRAPCGAAPAPAYAAPGAPPNLRAWSSGELSRDWVPPPCTGWSDRGFDVMVALAGSFRHDGSIEDLLNRIGAVSGLTGIRYWSTTDQAWRPLVTEAYALGSADPGSRRSDFTAAQMHKGRDLFYAQSDNRSSGRTVYRHRVLAVDANHVVVNSENVTAVRLKLLPICDAGDLQSVYFIEQRSPGVWAFYSLSRMRAGASPLSSGNERSYINRAVAYYRHVAGIPTDQEPPAAR